MAAHQAGPSPRPRAGPSTSGPRAPRSGAALANEPGPSFRRARFRGGGRPARGSIPPGARASRSRPRGAAGRTSRVRPPDEGRGQGGPVPNGRIVNNSRAERVPKGAQEARSGSAEGRPVPRRRPSWRPAIALRLREPLPRRPPILPRVPLPKATSSVAVALGRAEGISSKIRAAPRGSRSQAEPKALDLLAPGSVQPIW